MIDARIAEVRVRIRTDISDEAEIRPKAERIVRAVLERCAALLEQRAPGRVVLIRRLPLHWRLDESMVDDEAQVEHLARSAVDAIERLSLPPMLEPPESEDAAVIFDDEAHLRASYLLALARGSPAWFHAVVHDPAVDPLAVLAVPERRAMAHATLVRLARERILAEALAARPASAVAVFAAALGCNLEQSLRPEESAQAEADTAELNSGKAEALAELTAIASRWPTLDRAARSLALRVHAALLLDVTLEAPDAIALAKAALTSSLSLPAIEGKRTARLEARSPDDRAPTKDGAGLEELPTLSAVDAVFEETAAVAATRCGGLFFLLDRIQELDLAESLWKACLPEGAVLAAAASALLGSAFVDDKAPLLFGGVDAVACPEVTSEQHAEVAAATCTALAAALPRRGLADIPVIMVSLADHSTGRLLVAAAENSPFAFFAWPAATAAMLDAGLRALLDTWPHRSTLAATPALAALDTSGRLRPSRAKPHPLLLPEASGISAAALIAIVAGAPCLLFAARVRVSEPHGVEWFITRYLARQARIRTMEARFDVIFDSQGFDLDVRRAGLDRDPGWLPWLRRKVCFILDEQELTTGEQE
jgi:hypothetical protein